MTLLEAASLKRVCSIYPIFTANVSTITFSCTSSFIKQSHLFVLKIKIDLPNQWKFGLSTFEANVLEQQPCNVRLFLDIDNFVDIFQTVKPYLSLSRGMRCKENRELRKAEYHIIFQCRSLTLLQCTSFLECRAHSYINRLEIGFSSVSEMILCDNRHADSSSSHTTLQSLSKPVTFSRLDWHNSQFFVKSSNMILREHSPWSVSATQLRDTQRKDNLLFSWMLLTLWSRSVLPLHCPYIYAEL